MLTLVLPRLKLVLPRLNLVLPRLTLRLPGTYFSIAKTKFSIAKTSPVLTLILPRLNLELPRLTQISSIYLSVANSNLAGKSPIFPAAPKQADTREDPKTVTLKRTRTSCGQPPLCNWLPVLFSCLECHGLGTPNVCPDLFAQFVATLFGQLLFARIFVRHFSGKKMTPPQQSQDPELGKQLVTMEDPIPTGGLTLDMFRVVTWLWALNMKHLVEDD